MKVEKLKKACGHALPVEPGVGAPMPRVEPPLVQPDGKPSAAAARCFKPGFAGWAAFPLAREGCTGMEVGKLQAGDLEM